MVTSQNSSMENFEKSMALTTAGFPIVNVPVLSKTTVFTCMGTIWVHQDLKKKSKVNNDMRSSTVNELYSFPGEEERGLLQLRYDMAQIYNLKGVYYPKCQNHITQIRDQYFP